MFYRLFVLVLKFQSLLGVCSVGALCARVRYAPPLACLAPPKKEPNVEPQTQHGTPATTQTEPTQILTHTQSPWNPYSRDLCQCTSCSLSVRLVSQS